jgi:hypothetical protein
MLTPAQILDAAARKWPALLRSEARCENQFPLRIAFGRPLPSGDFATLRKEIELLASATSFWIVTWEETETRKWGRQRLPVRVEFDSIENLASALGRIDELQAFRSAVLLARTRCPSLEPWLRDRAHRLIEHLGNWERLIEVCSYFCENPRPRCYIRQLPIPVATKFVEENAGILRELLDVVVGEEVDSRASTFAGRFNLLVEPPQVRFRFLDDGLRAATGWPVMECSVPVQSFIEQVWNIPRVVVVENRDAFLSLPSITGTLAVFGAGKALTVLKPCRWLEQSHILYWGDCDEAGYGILSGLRSMFPHVLSVLMDESAWHQWKYLALPGKRDPSVRHDHLTETERTALALVATGPWMLEQERIPWTEAEMAIRAAIVMDAEQASGPSFGDPIAITD